MKCRFCSPSWRRSGSNCPSTDWMTVPSLSSSSTFICFCPIASLNNKERVSASPSPSRPTVSLLCHSCKQLWKNKAAPPESTKPPSYQICSESRGQSSVKQCCPHRGAATPFSAKSLRPTKLPAGLQARLLHGRKCALWGICFF